MELNEVKKRNNDFKRLLQTHDLGKRFLRENWDEANTFLGDCTLLIKLVEEQQKEIQRCEDYLNELGFTRYWTSEK